MIKETVKKILDKYPVARENVNICITLYMKSQGIKSVSPKIWGVADSVRRAWRYWINTQKLYVTNNEDERYALTVFYKREYSKNKTNEV